MSKRKIVLDDDTKSVDEQVTLIEVVLDGSGSMDSIRNDTIGGFNSFLRNQQEREDGGIVRLSLTQFNTFPGGRLKVIYDNIPINSVKPLTDKSYIPSGATPLLDAVGTRIKAVDKAFFKYKIKPAILFVIITDGEENSSIKFTNENIAALIKEREEFGWIFVFLGANQDAWEAGTGYGIAGGNTLNIADGGVGMVAAFNNLSRSTTMYRTAGSKYTESFFSGDDGDGNEKDTTPLVNADALSGNRSKPSKLNLNNRCKNVKKN